MIRTPHIRLACLPLIGLVGLPLVSHAEGNLLVTPIEILEEPLGCNEQNQMAYRLAFDAKALLARVGAPDSGRSERCFVRTRRGGELSEVVIPCPVPQGGEFAPVAPTDPSATVDFSGAIVGCYGMNGHSMVSLDWQLSGQAPSGVVSEAGDLSNPHLRVFFNAPTVQFMPPEGESITNPAVWAIVLEDLPINGPGGHDEAIALTTYLGLSDTELVGGLCSRSWNEPQECYEQPADGTTLARLLYPAGLDDIIRYVDEGRRQ
jgi:hypothetical protein